MKKIEKKKQEPKKMYFRESLTEYARHRFRECFLDIIETFALFDVDEKDVKKALKGMCGRMYDVWSCRGDFLENFETTEKEIDAIANEYIEKLLELRNNKESK